VFSLFNHVGLAVRDLDQAVRQWTEVFGLKVVDRFDVPGEGVRSVILSTGPRYGESACVELMQPLDPDDHSQPIARWLAEHGDGVYHLAFRVDDIDSSEQSLADSGARIYRVPPAGPETEPRLIVHPKSANGVLVELLGGPSPEC
jgi:methylmalonyl-CoA/ethylmalonyl-CoA epimerase